MCDGELPYHTPLLNKNELIDVSPNCTDIFVSYTLF